MEHNCHDLVQEISNCWRYQPGSKGRYESCSQFEYVVQHFSEYTHIGVWSRYTGRDRAKDSEYGGSNLFE